MKNKIIAVLLIVLLFGVAIYFTFDYRNNIEKSYKVKNDKVKIVTSFYPVYFLVNQITGDKADVYNLVPSGQEPHDFEPSAQDIATIENSQILLANGLGFEPWLENIKNSLGSKIIISELSSGLTEADYLQKDPHIWLDPVLVQKMVNKILENLLQVDPKNTDYYTQNAQNLNNKLAELDNDFKTGLGDCGKKEIVTSHMAFSYLAKRYGFNEISVAGLSPEEEPSGKQLADLVKIIKDKDIKYIFAEPLANQNFSNTLANETGAQILILNPIEGLTADELSDGKDYFTEMEINLQNLKIALDCK